MIDVDIYPFDEDFEFSTGYDQLVARIVAMKLLYAFLSLRRTYVQSDENDVLVNLLKIKGCYQLTGTVVQLAEIIYALDEVKCINSGNTTINDLSTLFGALFNIDLRECYGTYTYMKKRKNDSRTYFLDEMQKKLNQRMERDDEKERNRR